MCHTFVINYFSARCELFLVKVRRPFDFMNLKIDHMKGKSCTVFF
jgi:hypothetical protein